MTNMIEQIRSIGKRSQDSRVQDAIEQVIKIVEAAENARIDRFKAFSDAFDNIRWGWDGDCGSQAIVDRYIEGEFESRPYYENN